MTSQQLSQLVKDSVPPRQGLSHIMDNVSEYYNAVCLSASQSDQSGFVSPASVSLPVAKIIPLLSSQVRQHKSRLHN